MPISRDRVMLRGTNIAAASALDALAMKLSSNPQLSDGVRGVVRDRIDVSDGLLISVETPVQAVTVFSEPHLISRLSPSESNPYEDTQNVSGTAETLNAQTRDVQQRDAPHLPQHTHEARSPVAPQAANSSENKAPLALEELDSAVTQAASSNGSLSGRLATLSGELLANTGAGQSKLSLRPGATETGTSHDFSQYVFGRDPSSLFDLDYTPSMPFGSDIDEFLTRSRSIIERSVFSFSPKNYDNGYTVEDLTPYFPGFVETIFRLFIKYVASDIYVFYKSIVPGYAGGQVRPLDDVLSHLEQWMINFVNSTGYRVANISGSFDDPQRWTTVASEVISAFEADFRDVKTEQSASTSDEYGFRPYASAINFGLRLVYRQQWRPLGNRVGDIIKTLPLGPKQTEKVSIRTVITRKEVRSSERSSSQETSNDTTSSTKDSNEVVREASEKFNWNVSAEAGVNIGVVSAKLNAGLGGDTASNSKDTKSRLNEAMSKTASRMKLDTKVIVSTEIARTDEFTSNSEIVNPNDDIALTFVYSKLVRQYNVSTSLSEVNSVIFVAERVPRPEEVDADFVRHNARSIVRVLLDPIYQPEIEGIVSEPNTIDLRSINQDRGSDLIKETASKAKDSVGGLTSFYGQSLPDFVTPTLDAQIQELTHARETEADVQRRSWRRESLFSHLRKNILHYMRGIWSDEDRDQRWLRYGEIRVPTRWMHDGMGISSGTPSYRDGYYRPDFAGDSLRPLTDIINPAGPISYVGNYAVFLMRGSPRLANMNAALATMRSFYLGFDVIAQAPDGISIRQATVYDPVAANCTYHISLGRRGWTGSMTLDDGTSFSVSVRIGGALQGSSGEDRQIDIDSSVRLFYEGRDFEFRDAFTLRVISTQALKDPELTVYQMLYPLPAKSDESSFFSAQLLAEMGATLPDVADVVGSEPVWDDLTSELARDFVRGRFHEFLLIRANSTRIALDTNSVVLDVEVGATPALEPFKRLHRFIDVEKEVEERIRRRIENMRRVGLLHSGNYSDSDIDRLSVIGTREDLQSIVRIDPDPSP